jgi:hypothetical protein
MRLVPQGFAEDEPARNGNPSTPPPQTPPAKGKVQLVAGERELTAGLLSKDANFRLIVSGNVRVQEIKRLIKKLQLDKEILANGDDG